MFPIVDTGRKLNAGGGTNSSIPLNIHALYSVYNRSIQFRPPVVHG